jgi:hypothetical protein
MISFSFKLLGDGTADQRILFKTNGEPDVEIPVPDQVFSTDVEEAFWQQYAILVSQGKIPNDTPIFEGVIAPTQTEQQ